MNLSKIEIVKAKLSDIDKLQLLGERTFFESFSSQNTAEDMENYLSENFNREKILSELDNPESEFYLAKIQRANVGYLKLNFGSAQTDIKDQNSIEIERIYVLSDYQGNKIGQVLYNQALQIANERNALYIWLGVWEKNLGAIRFYKKIGFEEFGRHDFVLGYDVQTDVIMKLKISRL